MKEYRTVDALSLAVQDKSSHQIHRLFKPGSSSSLDNLLAANAEVDNLTPSVILNQELMNHFRFSGDTLLVVLDDLKESKEKAPAVRCKFDYYDSSILADMRQQLMTPVPGVVPPTEFMTAEWSDQTVCIARTDYKWVRIAIAPQIKSPTVRYIIDRMADWNDVGNGLFMNSHDFLFTIPEFYANETPRIESRMRGLFADAAYRDWRWGLIDPTWSEEAIEGAQAKEEELE